MKIKCEIDKYKSALILVPCLWVKYHNKCYAIGFGFLFGNLIIYFKKDEAS